MYSLLDYGWMIRASARRDAYVEALRRSVRPGCTVLEIGSGPGFFAVLAARLGAARVWAVDPDESVHLGKELAKDNGVADRVTFVQGKVEELTLPAPVDVIVSDLRGVLPVLRGHFAAVAHARKHLLAKGGALIPTRDTLWVAASDDAKVFEPWRDPWTLAPEGISLQAVRRFAVNAWQKGRVTPESLLAPAQAFATLDYATLEDTGVGGRAELEVQRAGTLQGLTVWFDTELVPGVGFSNGPSAPPLVYGSAAFPIERSVDVAPGMRIAVEFGATPATDEYDWRWRVTVTAPGQDAPLLDERHHSMMGRPLAPLTKTLAKKLAASDAPGTS